MTDVGDTLLDPGLQRIQLLEGAAGQSIREIQRAGRMHLFDTQAQIIVEGDKGHDVHFILEGSVQVIAYDDRDRLLSLDVLTAGSYFGELSAIDGKPRSATVVSLTPATIFSVAAEKFMQVVLSDPLIAARLLRRLAGMVRASDDHIRDLSFFSPSQRVCIQLVKLAEPDPNQESGWLVYPMPTQTEIAASIGSSRATVARTLSRLFEQGVVTRRSKTLYIKDRGALQSLALS